MLISLQPSQNSLFVLSLLYSIPALRTAIDDDSDLAFVNLIFPHLINITLGPIMDDDGVEWLLARLSVSKMAAA
jgi:hypothetical protein